jgi:hypothetical protein
MTTMARLGLCALVAGAFVLGACATTMKVESTPPGAQILYEGKPVGTAPTSIDVPSGGMGSTVELTVQKNGLTKTVQVPRSEIDWKSLGVGAGIDTVACLGLSGASAVAGFVLPLCLIGVCAAPLVYAEVPVQLMFAGASVPSSFTASMEGASAKPPEAPPPPPPGTSVAPSYGY